VKQRRNNLNTYIIVTPLLLVCIALIFLGAYFVQGYEIGNVMPHAQDEKVLANDPAAEPSIDTIDIADTSNLPSKMPSVPTPARQITTLSMKHKESSTPQPARPLPPVAEAATSTPPPVNNAVKDAIEQQQPPTPETPPADNSAPVPPIPEPQTPPLVD
jgi:hypothetical protein